MAGKLVGWLKIENNREAALALLTVASALLGGGWFLYDRLFPGGDGGSAAQSIEVGGDAGSVQQVAEGGVAVVAGAGAVVTVGYTVEQHEERLARREAELRAELAGAHAGEKAALLAQLDEVRRQMADAEASWAVRKAELGRAMARLDAVAAGLQAARLDAARRALDEGDTAKADALFAEVEAMEAAAVERAAAAAFERGKLAEGEVRWADAAGHYATAARLDPSYDHLFAAREMAWRSGDYPAALRWGEDLLRRAVLEHGEGSTGHADGPQRARPDAARRGPLRRGGAALPAGAGDRREDARQGAPRPTPASLNNLAALLRDTGRHAEAEPLFRQALAIDEKALGKEHPDYAIRPQQPRGAAAWTWAITPRRSRSSGRRWRSTRRRSARTIPTTRPTSTTSRCCCRRRAATPRRSRSTGGRWRSTRRRSARSTPTMRHPQQPRGAAAGHGPPRRGGAALPAGAGDRREDAR